MIEISNLTKTFGKQAALVDLSIRFDTGKCIALIGPNGSGKTTLIKCILGIVHPNGGTITVNEQAIDQSPNYRQQVGYMPQISRFPESMNVAALFHLMKKIRVDCTEYDLELYEQFEIDKMLDKKLGNLSGGMAQKVSAALAFLFHPQIIILDEPTAGLDPQSNELLKEKINQSIQMKKLVLITSHILNDLDEITTDVVYLLNGEIHFQDTLTNLQSKTTHSRLNKIIAELTK